MPALTTCSSAPRTISLRKARVVPVKCTAAGGNGSGSNASSTGGGQWAGKGGGGGGGGGNGGGTISFMASIRQSSSAPSAEASCLASGAAIDAPEREASFVP